MGDAKGHGAAPVSDPADELHGLELRTHAAGTVENVDFLAGPAATQTLYDAAISPNWRVLLFDPS
jgi:hypothetical protein